MEEVWDNRRGRCGERPPASSGIGDILALSRRWRENGRYRDAWNAIEEAASRAPANDAVYFERCLWLKEQRRYEKAAAQFRRGLEANPGNEMLLGALAQLWLRERDGEAACRLFDELTALRMGRYNPVTRRNYRSVGRIVRSGGIRLGGVQYPVRSVEPLKRLFYDPSGIIFVDNEKVFKEALKRKLYRCYFIDMCGGYFGHCTAAGNRLVAENVADTLCQRLGWGKGRRSVATPAQ